MKRALGRLFFLGVCLAFVVLQGAASFLHDLGDALEDINNEPYL